MNRLAFRLEHKQTGLGPFEQAFLPENRHNCDALCDFVTNGGGVPDYLGSFETARKTITGSTGPAESAHWAKQYRFACHSLDALYVYFRNLSRQASTMKDMGFHIRVYALGSAPEFEDNIQMAYRFDTANVVATVDLVHPAGQEDGFSGDVQSANAADRRMAA